MVCAKSTITYTEALQILQHAGQDAARGLSSEYDTVTLESSIGRRAKHDILSPMATPPFDTSAMDGFVLDSRLTASASEADPVRFVVRGMMAAGDSPISISNACEEGDDESPCVEIMTGAQFPTSTHYQFDAVVPIEHTRDAAGSRQDRRCIELYRPVLKNQHRRFAGEDFSNGCLIVEANSMIGASHIMAMASVNIRKVAVLPKVRIGVWSSGAELAENNEKPEPNRIRDANGPFILAALRSQDVEVDFLGVLEDDQAKVASSIGRFVDTGKYDAIITTGAVSAGKFDHIRQAIDSIGAHVRFHGVAMRPGHPVLFAEFPSINTGGRRTVLFGLPGNPLAAGICLRVIVAPFLENLCRQPPRKSIFAQVVAPKQCRVMNGGSTISANVLAQVPSHLDVFRHGLLYQHERDFVVEMGKEQSPSKIRPFALSNCWVHIPRGHGDVNEGKLVECISLASGQSIL